MTELRRVTGLPTEAEANMRITIWRATPGNVPGTDRVEQEGSTWTASMEFDDSPADEAGEVAANGGFHAEPMMGLAKLCPSCGEENLSSAKRCASCGEPLGLGGL